MSTTRSALSASVVFDAANPGAAAAFWAAFAGGKVGDGTTAEYATVERPGDVDFAFNRVSEVKSAKNRVHVDLTVRDLQEAEAQAVALGASVVARYDGWTTMQDPESNEFCILAD